MEILSVIALVMLVLVGYSGGSVLASRGSSPPPGLIDLVLIVALWTTAFVVRPDIGRWPAITFGVVTALLVAAAAMALRHPQAAASVPREARADAGGRGLDRATGAWRAFALELGNYQGRLIMAFLYFGVVTPFALIGGRTRRVQAPRPDAGTRWLDRTAGTPTLDHARRQF